MSHCSHDEAVEAFLSAEEPIVVEVLRRAPSPQQQQQQQIQHSVSDSRIASKRNSAYIPPTAASPPLPTAAIQTGVAVLGARDEDLLDGDGSSSNDLLLLPDLDYEVRGCRDFLSVNTANFRFLMLFP